MAERESEAWLIGTTNEPEPKFSDNLSNNPQNPVEIYIPPISNANKIREIRKQLKGAKNG